MTAVLPQVCRGKAAVQAEQKREHARYKASGCTDVPTAAKPAGHGGTPLAGHEGSCKATNTTRKHGALGRRGRANRPANAREMRQGRCAQGPARHQLVRCSLLVDLRSSRGRILLASTTTLR